MADMFEYMKWRGNRKTAFAFFDDRFEIILSGRRRDE